MDEVSTDRSASNNQAVFRRNLLATVKSLTDRAVRVVLIGPLPEIGWDVPRNVARRNVWNANLPPLPSREEFLSRQRTVLAVLNEAAALPNVEVLRPDRVLCDDVCGVEREGKVLCFDDNHLSIHGVTLPNSELVALLKRPALLEDAAGSSPPSQRAEPR